uniref:Cytochrome P450 31 n=1 Tax=Streltzoviella insularis TaxID=1206366 RepID=A0A7D5UMT7_9NEOP|nr:cytochrome P450 31 [Streltzoviella insularis]
MLCEVFLAVFTVYSLWKLFLNEKEHPLDRVPGPPPKPLFGNALDLMFASPRELFIILRQYAKDYGDKFVLRIFSKRIIQINGPKEIEIVLSHSRNITKSKHYVFLRPWLGTGLLVTTGSKWHTRRKILTPTFHFNILKNFATVMEEKSRHMVELLKAKYNDTEVDLMPFISDFTLYIICETAMGTQLDFDKSEAAVTYKNAVLDMGGYVLNRTTKVWLQNEFIFKKLNIGRQFATCLNKIHSFVDNVIMERKKNSNQSNKNDVTKALDEEVIGGKRRLALLDLLLEAESKGEINLEGIREEVNTFMFAGLDTTATAMTFGLMLLADHEDVQERIYEECQEIFGDSDRTPSMTDLAQMKYLEAVIKETLRLYPSAPFIARRITEDFMMGDVLVPKGTEVGIHIYDLHHRADLYPDPEVFKPERFLNGELRHPYAFVPFSAGPRNCLGQRFAMQEMKCILSEICRNFALVPRQKGYRPALIVDMVLRPIEPIYVKFVRRQK